MGTILIQITTIDFNIKPILSNEYITIPPLFWSLFAYNICFYPLICNICISIQEKYVSWGQHIIVSCLLLRKLSLFILKTTNDEWGFTTIVLLLVLLICALFSVVKYFTWYLPSLLFFPLFTISKYPAFSKLQFFLMFLLFWDYNYN